MDAGNAVSCPHCGAIDVPRTGPGKGPHGAALVCRHCGRWLKWAKKVRTMETVQGVNKVVLVGKITDRGVELQYLPSGQPLATFSLVLEEAAKTGDVYKTYVPCEVYGAGAEPAGDLDAGALVLFEGRLRWKKGDQGKDGKLVVAGFEVKPLTPAAVTAARSN